MEPTSIEWNQALALSLKEKGKRCNLTASWFAFKLQSSDFNGLKRIVKSTLGLLVHLDDKPFTNQTLNLELYIGPTFKRQVSLKPVTSPLGFSEIVPLATTPILMVDCY
ncbi:hypothetical protein MTR_6g465900 [Medicago truncatula]|uniref:Uncharacterized protein n=1 Tax=Medicago truncatula TaxID=3880 RepID=A0A072UAD1_MEDTR|nr:hypothetical protein MTR_6g465900 [Medicago truncatula]